MYKKKVNGEYRSYWTLAYLQLSANQRVLIRGDTIHNYIVYILYVL